LIKLDYYKGGGILGRFLIKKDLIKKDLIIKYIVIVLACIVLNEFNTIITSYKLEKMAINYFYEEQYHKAIQSYKVLAKTERSNALWDARIAEIYYLIKDNENCEEYLKSAKNK